MTDQELYFSFFFSLVAASPSHPVAAKDGSEHSFACGIDIDYNHVKFRSYYTPTKIAIPQEKVRDFCRRNHIQKLSLFGSVLRDDFGSESDIDVLVEFEPGAGVGFFELYDMEKELSLMFGGRKVEITTPRSLSKYFRDSVLKNAEVQYAGT